MKGSESIRHEDAKEAALQTKRAETGEYLTTCALVDLDGYLTDALTQVLLAEVKLNGESEAKPHITRTAEILQTGRSMTQEILDSQPPSAPQIERLDLNQIVRKAGRNFLTWSPENIHLQLELSPSLPQVPGDRLQLERLVICLLVNMALLCVTGEHRLTLSTRQCRPEAAASAVEPDHEGFDPHAEERVFEPRPDEVTQRQTGSISPVHSVSFRFSLTRHAVQHQQGLLSVRRLPGGEVRISVRFPGGGFADSAPPPEVTTVPMSGVMLEMIRVPAD